MCCIEPPTMLPGQALISLESPALGSCSAQRIPRAQHPSGKSIPMVCMRNFNSSYRTATQTLRKQTHSKAAVARQTTMPTNQHLLPAWLLATASSKNQRNRCSMPHITHLQTVTVLVQRESSVTTQPYASLPAQDCRCSIALCCCRGLRRQHV